MVRPTTRSSSDLHGKRLAIMRGASVVFARDGYTRASIDQIAAEAGASTRTLYNHFGDKAGLFEEVIRTSAEQVAQAQIALIDKHLSKIVDLEQDLTDFALDWIGPHQEFDSHFALVRQIQADATHIPASALTAWREAGPARVRRAFAAQLQRLADNGLLDITDAGVAVAHFVGLITPESPASLYTTRSAKNKIRAHVTAGVHVFLHGYSPTA